MDHDPKSSKPQQRPDDGPPKGEPKKRPSAAVLWYIIGGVFLILVLYNIQSPGRDSLKYSKFKKLVAENKVASCTVGTGKIYGELKQPDPETKRKSFSVDRLGVDEQALYKLLDAHEVEWTGEQEAGWLGAALTWVLVIGLILLFWFFLLRRMGPAGSAMTFGRSKGKLLAQEDMSVTFDDVAGADEAKEELIEIIEFLRNPDKYRILGGKLPKGVLLVGSPGTGKTLLAKAVAGEANAPFFSLTGSDFVEMFVGVGAARVRDMFAQADQRAPCIIFIDELDALGKARGINVMGGHDEREQTLNQLLAEMDGFDSNRGVIIMGATNRPEILDPALLRPGRFDRHIVVDRPDINGREAILEVHAKNVRLAEKVDLRRLAAITPGFVGADLANLINEAALLAARRGKDAVEMAELQESVERVVAGLEKRKRVMNPKEKERIAYHECGHALMASFEPGAEPVHKISIIPRGVAALGYTMHRPAEDRYLVTQSELMARMKSLLGGITAEEIVFGEVSTGAQNDLERVSEIARSMVKDFGMSETLGRVNFRNGGSRTSFLGGPLQPFNGHAKEYSEQTAREIDLEVKRLLEEAGEGVRQTLQERRELLTALAKELMEKEIIESDDLERIVLRETGQPLPNAIPSDTPAADTEA